MEQNVDQVKALGDYINGLYARIAVTFRTKSSWYYYSATNRLLRDVFTSFLLYLDYSNEK